MTAAPTVEQEPIIVGIDTHKDIHHAAILSARGALIADQQFPATSRGYAQLLAWTATVGPVAVFGIECTGSYGAGLVRHLLAEGHDVREVNRPHAHTAARRGKTDAIDAEAAARKILAGEAPVVPKNTSGVVESIRMLTLARNSAVKARSIAQTQLQNVLVTAPGELREQINATTGPKARIAACRRLRPDTAGLTDPMQAAKLTLRTLANRVEVLNEEIGDLDQQLGQLVAATTPTLVSKIGIGTGHAAQFLISAGENVGRLHTDAAFARLCGVAPIPVASGKTHRMRLHRGGDRQANRALHMIAVVRLRYDPRTVAYMERRRAEGLSKKDVLRCLKRFIAREVYNDLRRDLSAVSSTRPLVALEG
ncbi:IS110 family transposase [Dietzia timorensis]|uniref:Insertion element IS110 uncharacterized 43.6 kDa protein n=1 Tax=Dietzia timorensis TaxID=499555 RepID=A0A173LF90_9ACTN|nr:IS110 family transposase [Dietzia timorensis]ANI90885.1 Insertion element IS110 uncharacterized 43.6 kDa protein [Dietzia timorensis]